MTEVHDRNIITRGKMELFTAVEQGDLVKTKSLLESRSGDEKADLINSPDQSGMPLLHIASQKGHLDLVKYLNDHGAEINKPDGEGFTALHLASRNGHLDVVQYLVENRSELESGRDTPLYVASRENHLGVVRYLVREGANVNRQSYNGALPLYIASHEGHLSIVTYLVENDAALDMCNINGISPLYAASINGHLSVVQSLVNAGAEVDKTTNIEDTPIHAASRRGHADIVKELANAGADVNKTLYGESPLHAALRQGHTDVVKFLRAKKAMNVVTGLKTPLYVASRAGNLPTVVAMINAGDDVNIGIENGETPLHAASSEGYNDIVECLVNAGADMNKASMDGDTPIFAAIREGHIDIAKYLITKGADLDMTGSAGRTPLHIASQKGHLGVAEYLVNAGADVNKASNDGNTPLLAASSIGDLEIVKYLINKGKTLDFANKEGDTPFSLALKKGHLGIAEYLVIAGADVNKAPLVERALLHAASRHGYINVVRYLVPISSGVDTVDELGFTPLHYAAQNGHLGIAKCLVDAGGDVNTKAHGGYFCHFSAEEHATFERSSTCTITPLHLASYAGHLSIVEYLVHAGADVNEALSNDSSPLETHPYGNFGSSTLPEWTKRSNFEGITSLHLASYAGHLSIVEYLAQAGADVNQASVDGITPLYAALSACLLDTSSDLRNLRRNLKEAGLDAGMFEFVNDIRFVLPEIQHGIRKHHVNSTKREAAKASSTTQLHTPANKSYLDIVTYLVNTKGAQADKSSKFGLTPLQLASHAGHLGAVECLVNAGADVNKTAKHGDMPPNLNIYAHKTPLYIASEEGHLGIVQCLLKSGADVNMAIENGDTPLHAASNESHFDIVKYLTMRGANLHASNKDGITPLHTASMKGGLKIVEYLVEAGANVNTVSTRGEGPFQAASRMGHDDVVQYLSEVCKNRSTTPDQTAFQHLPSHSVIDPGKSIKGRKLNEQESRRENYFTKGIFTSKGGELSIPSHGFNLSIPPQALDSSQEISLQPLFDLPSGIDFKQNEIVASLGFKCKPSGIIFKKPVKLTIPHCALISDPERVKCMLYTEGKDGSYVRAEASGFIPHHGKMDIFLDHFCDVHPVLEGSGVDGKVMLCAPFLPKASPEKEKETIVRVNFYIDCVMVQDRVLKQENSQQYRPAYPEQELIIYKDPQGSKDPHSTVVQCTIMNSTFNKEKTVPNQTLLKHRWHTVPCYPKPPECDSIIVINLLPHDKEMPLSPGYTEEPSALRSPNSSTPHSTTTAGSGASSADSQEVTDEHVTNLSGLIPSDYLSAVCIALGIEKTHADNLRVEKKENYHAIYEALLQKWRYRSEVSLKDLDEVLEKAELGGLVKKYKKKIGL